MTSLHVHPSRPHLVVSASADGTLRTWDARTGALVKEHTGHTGPINQAALALGGAKVLTAGDDGACLVFDATE